MHTANYIRTVAIFSAFAFICLVLMTIGSYGNHPSQNWTTFAFVCVGMIGFGTYNSLKSIHKRISELENRKSGNSGDTIQA